MILVVKEAIIEGQVILFAGSPSGLTPPQNALIAIDESADEYYKNENNAWVLISSVQAQTIIDELGNTLANDAGDTLILG